MPLRRGLAAPQNTFIDTIIKKFDGPGRNFVLANATIEHRPIIYCNEGICQLYGHSRATLMQTSSNCQNFKGPQTNDKILSAIDHFLREPDEQQIDIILYKSDGSPVSVSVLVAPIVNEKREIVMYLVNHQELKSDETESKSNTKHFKLNKLVRLRYGSKRSKISKSISHGTTPDPTDDEAITDYSADDDRRARCILGDLALTSPDEDKSEDEIKDSRTLSDSDEENKSEHVAVSFRPRSHSTAFTKEKRGSTIEATIRRSCSASTLNKATISEKLDELRKTMKAATEGCSDTVFAYEEVQSAGNGLNRNSDRRKASDLVAKFISLNKTTLPEYKLEELKIPPFTILHYSMFKAFWDWLILVIVLYTAVVTPFVASFVLTQDVQRSYLDQNPETRTDRGTTNPYTDPLFIIDWIVDITFIVDIFINFRTTFVNSKDEIVTDWRYIAIHYIKSWLIVDLIAAIPFELFISGEQNEQTITLIGLLKTARLLRVIRVVRKADRYSETGAAILVLLMFTFALIAHWLACIWYAIAIAERPYINPKYTWLDLLAEEIHKSFKNSTALLGGPTIMDRYITALYFTFSSLTTVGFGNVSANTQSEKIFAIVIMWFGALLSASIFGNVTAIIQRLYASTARYHSHMKKIKEFAKFHKIPYPLKRRLLEYFQHTWSYHKGIDMTSVLKSFPESLQADISLHLNRNLLHNTEAFSKCSPSCLRSLAFKIQSTHCPPGDYLVMQGDKLAFLYFISRGSVEILRGDVVIAILGVGDIFGENFYKYSTEIKSCANVRALTYCDLHTISKESLLEVLHAYPDFADHFSKTLEITFNLKERRELNDHEESIASATPDKLNQSRRNSIDIASMNCNVSFASGTNKKLQSASLPSTPGPRRVSNLYKMHDLTKPKSSDDVKVKSNVHKDTNFSRTVDKIINAPKVMDYHATNETELLNSKLPQELFVVENISCNGEMNKDVLSFSSHKDHTVDKELYRQVKILEEKINNLERNLSKDLKAVLALVAERYKPEMKVSNAITKDC